MSTNTSETVTYCAFGLRFTVDGGVTVVERDSVRVDTVFRKLNMRESEAFAMGFASGRIHGSRDEYAKGKDAGIKQTQSAIKEALGL